MKRNQDVDYIELETNLRNIDESYETLGIDFNFSNHFDLTCYTGKSNSKFYMISSDVQCLTKQLIFYFNTIIKNFIFVDLYDKTFIESFKVLVKDKEEFQRFLNMTQITVDDFLHLGVYICPNAFTSTLIKFIQTNYLNIKIVKSKKKTKK